MVGLGSIIALLKTDHFLCSFPCVFLLFTKNKRMVKETLNKECNFHLCFPTTMSDPIQYSSICYVEVTIL